MNWLEALNGAIGSMEESLAGEVDLAAAARRCGCTQRQFGRLFAYVAGATVNEYIRRRRLTLAAADLAAGYPVTEVALRYGYDSPTAFTRAFRAQHGIPPSEAKQPGARLVAYPRIRFHLTIQGDVEMEYQLKNMPDLKLVGYRRFMTLENDRQLRDIPAYWGELTPEKIAALTALMDAEPKGLIGGCGEMHDGGFEYYIGVVTTKDAPEGMFTLDVPAATWAVFGSTGPLPHTLQAVIRRFYAEWLPASGYAMVEDTPELEVYPDPRPGTTEDYYCEAWMPVVKK